VFLLCLLLLSLAATPYSRAADHALMAARFAIVIVLSVLLVHERCKYRHDPRRAGAAIAPRCGRPLMNAALELIKLDFRAGDACFSRAVSSESAFRSLPHRSPFQGGYTMGHPGSVQF
jgi:hypothetical protein